MLHICLSNSAICVRQGLLLNLALTDSARMIGQNAPGVFIFLFPSAEIIIGTCCHVQLFTWVLRIQTQVL